MMALLLASGGTACLVLPPAMRRHLQPMSATYAVTRVSTLVAHDAGEDISLKQQAEALEAMLSGKWHDTADMCKVVEDPLLCGGGRRSRKLPLGGAVASATGPFFPRRATTS